MPSWKTKLIQAYRLCSLPYRQFRWINMARRGAVPVIVLFYHRIADDHPNKWSMSRADFTKQIDWFQNNFDLVDLEEAQNRMRNGSNHRPTLAITFDDGYAENCEYALPLLIERKIPATYFVTTHHIANQAPFPHDLERGCPLPVNSIDSLLALDLAGIEIGAHTRSHVDLGEITDERVLVDEVITASLELEAMIGRKLRYFAFPYGQTANLNGKVFGLLHSAGFKGVCSAYGGWNEIGADPFHIQRIHGDPNFERMKNWLTFDPRIGSVKRYKPVSETFDQQLFDEAVAAAKSHQGACSTLPLTSSSTAAPLPSSSP